MVSENALRDAGVSGVAIAVIAPISSSLKSTRGGIMKYLLSQVHLQFALDWPVFSLSTLPILNIGSSIG